MESLVIYGMLAYFAVLTLKYLCTREFRLGIYVSAWSPWK
jgi:hypothetical protein